MGRHSNNLVWKGQWKTKWICLCCISGLSSCLVYRLLGLLFPLERMRDNKQKTASDFKTQSLVSIPNLTKIHSNCKGFLILTIHGIFSVNVLFIYRASSPSSYTLTSHVGHPAGHTLALLCVRQPSVTVEIVTQLCLYTYIHTDRRFIWDNPQTVDCSFWSAITLFSSVKRHVGIAPATEHAKQRLIRRCAARRKHNQLTAITSLKEICLLPSLCWKRKLVLLE